MRPFLSLYPFWSFQFSVVENTKQHGPASQGELLLEEKMRAFLGSSGTFCLSAFHLLRASLSIMEKTQHTEPVEFWILMEYVNISAGFAKTRSLGHQHSAAYLSPIGGPSGAGWQKPYQRIAHATAVTRHPLAHPRAGQKAA